MVVALLVGVAALRGTLDGVPDRDAPAVSPLRPAGDRYAGVAIRADLLDDEGYAELAARAYGAVTPENELKWERTQPERGRYTFDDADRVVDWARSHGMRVRGHALVWHLQNPRWLTDLRPSRRRAIALLRDHIRTVMGHFRGRIHEWDVVNEAVEDDRGALRDTPWLRWIGPEYVDLAFRFAREADPRARLVYNDYGAEQEGTKADGVLRLLRGLKARGVPVDAVGLQGHVSTERLPGFTATLERYAALGLDVLFTEVDVRVPVGGDGAPTGGEAALADQAGRYATLARGCVALPACKGFVVWGVDDADSWVPEAYPGEGAALPFDGDLREKPAYGALRDALAGG
ncbi:endo-1,4-beta-xylanase [Conexibacter sp. SYSU D00693]|uniref:endo-1,4-beta-xylanase n=1 Tax=Conexibacter sp. SYSU D00693 TaxID=2812560 RepID=UPI00196B7EBB|nr:endo-1,4-beta-xylanase [Conexibacter sp. SYSU D00693]